MSNRSTWMMAALLSSAFTVPVFAADGGPDLKQPAGKEWPAVAGSWDNSRYSTLKQIDTANVKTLGGAWVHKFDGETSRASPVIADGMMFITAGAHVYAFNPATGEQIWAFQPEAATSGMYKGVAVGAGLVYVGLSNGHIVALKEKTGELVWTGAVSDDPPLKGQALPAGPTYVNGMVITGMANGDYGLAGRIVALDAKTGKQVWRFNTIPVPGEPGHDTWSKDNDEYKKGGGGVWVNGAVDPALGLIYFGVGNPVPQWGGELRVGDNLYTDSVVALDIKTGKRRWHFQVVHHDIWEQDLGTPMVLYDTVVDGKTRKGVAAMRTDGMLFLLDRATGKPIFPVEERPVPQDPRLFTAPTQPFSVGADQLGPKCEPKEQIPAGFKPLCEFDPINYDTPNAMYPILTTRSAPMSYSPQTKMFYAAGSPGWPLWIKRYEDPKFFIATSTGAGIKTHGILAAIDAKTNKIVWQKQTPYEIQNSGGFTTTAGGLAFHGEPDGNLQAYDAKTGDLLWQFQTGSNAGGPVASYEVNGEQYVALPAAGSLWAFKLGGTVQPLPAPTPPKTETTMSGRVVSTDQVTFSPEISDTGLEFVRKTIDEHAVMPMRIKIPAGGKVTWSNKGKVVHDAVAMDGSWNSGDIAPGATGSVTFAKAGTYDYTSKSEPWLHAQIVVEEAAVAAPAPAPTQN
ncbi:MAG: quinonprotein alcohol dehydrogenase [Rhodospirillales bacterium]|nr:quinonprotein alcohol dehydrogenase [Rhodospirillales bacterium]